MARHLIGKPRRRITGPARQGAAALAAGRWLGRVDILPVIHSGYPSFRRKPESNAFAAVFVRISCRICPRNRRRNGTEQLRNSSCWKLSTWLGAHLRAREIPACAGMSVEGVGMTTEGVSMTVEGAGMAIEVKPSNRKRYPAGAAALAASGRSGRTLSSSRAPATNRTALIPSRAV